MSRPIFALGEFGMLVALSFVSVSTGAADASYTQSSSTQVGARQTASAAGNATSPAASQEEAVLQMQAQFWGISMDDVRRANLLMKGPRGAFSVPNISPVEVLGIHARSDAERQKYAELFAKALHADTERVLAWSVAHAQAMQRLYPNEKVVDFSRNPNPPVVDAGVAEAAHVPQSAIIKAQRNKGAGQR